ncbi:MAG TPA: L-asparaginase [Blastocatellia bacterium]|jgi:L-asparaginase II|nr:L-asparaginase [Blastocatellia bacterium]HAF22969.1 L-asparaginase [Blastocatellia bacterium]
MQVSRQPSENNQEVPAAESLVEVTRGGITESRHRGHIIAVEPEGNIVAYLGAPETVTYLRSSAKPHQAIPLITSGAADRFGFSEKEIALACASHSGEAIHTEVAASMLQKIGLEPSALKCGTHEPFSPEAARQLREKGEEPNVLQNNCSGKHAGMLALALHLGAPIESYDQPSNPVQLAIGGVISQFTGIQIQDIAVGVDGCGVPVFGVTVKAMALMYARLIAPPPEFDDHTKAACARIVSAMMTYPELIGGSNDRLDTEIMRAAKGRLVSKVGAEGVYTVGVLPCKDWRRGIGIALKIEDGDDHRARPTVVIESLRQLGILADESLEAVSRYAFFPVKNRRGDVVGEVTAEFELNRTAGTQH